MGGAATHRWEGWRAALIPSQQLPAPHRAASLPLLVFVSFLTISEVKKRQSGCAIVGLLAGAALLGLPGSAPGLHPEGFFLPSVGVWLLELLLSGLNAAKSAWCIRFPPRLGGCARWLCQNCVLSMRGGLQGHLGSLLSSKELLGTGAGMLLGALKSSRRRKSKI